MVLYFVNDLLNEKAIGPFLTEQHALVHCNMEETKLQQQHCTTKKLTVLDTENIVYNVCMWSAKRENGERMIRFLADNDVPPNCGLVWTLLSRGNGVTITSAYEDAVEKAILHF